MSWGDIKLKRRINTPVTAILVIAAATLVIILSFSHYTFLVRNTFTEDIQKNLMTEATQNAQIVSSGLKCAAASAEEFSRALETQPAPMDKGRMQGFLEKMKPSDPNTVVAYVQPDGTCCLRDGRVLQIADRAYFKKAIGGCTVTSSVENSRLDGSRVIVVAAPVKIEGKVAGVVEIILPTNKIDASLSGKDSEDSSETSIVLGNGTILSTTDPKKRDMNIFSSTNLSFEDRDDLKNIQSNMKTGKPGNSHYYTDQDEYFVYYMPLGIEDWYIFKTVSINEITFKTNKIMNYTIPLMAQLVVAMLLFILYIVFSERKNRQMIRKKNDELRSTKVELETFISNLPGGAFRCNDSENMEFQFVSDGLLKMSGYTKEKFLEKYKNSFCNMIYEEDRVHTLNSIQQQFTQGKFAEVKYRVITAKGKIRWLLNRVQIVTNEDGQRQFYAVVVDITESKQAHKKANDAMKQLLTLANSIPGGVAQYLYEEGKLKLVYASEGFYRLCGYTEDEYESQKHEGIENVHPDDSHFLTSMISRQIEEKRPIMAEFRMIQNDGRIIWVSLSGTRTVNQNQQVIYQCVFSDITSLKKAQEELEVEQERYQIAENLSDDIMFEYDIPADCMGFSPLFTALTGRYPNISGFLKNILQNESICEKDLPGFKAYLNELRLGNANSETEIRFITKSGDSVWHRIKSKIIYDSYGKPSKAIGKAYNIDKQKKEMQRLLDKSQRDPLTNLFNKTATQSQIEDHLADSAPVEKHALMMIDIDNFKAINDQFGHMTGDEVIMEISHRLQKLFRTSDVVGRIGGDEFIVFLRDISTDDLIEEKAKAMCEIFRSTHASKDLSYQISGSIGIALFPADGKTYQELYPKADAALYKAKRRGKDCYTFYSEEEQS